MWCVDHGPFKLFEKVARNVCLLTGVLTAIFFEEGHGKMVDYWALGLILYELIVGATPWAKMNATDMFFNVLTKPVPQHPLLSTESR